MPEIAELMRAIESVKADLGARIGGIEQKLDALPDTYVQRRELETLVEQQRTTSARLDKFDEWRMSMIERMYVNLRGVDTRVDDARIDDARRETSAVRQQAHQQQQSSSSAQQLQARYLGIIVTLILTVGGWVLGLWQFVAAHWH